MPPSWEKYVVKEERDNQTVIINFGLTLETDVISQWLSESEKNERIFKIWSLHIILIPQWELQKRKCEDLSVDYPCFYPEEITRNEKHVFGSGLFFTAGGWDPCYDDEARNQETYFCSVYLDMSLDRGYNIKESFSLL